MSRLALSPMGTELLDDPAADPAAVEESLRNIARANRWFGGWDAVRYGLDRLTPFAASTVTLLDVGTGAGDLPRMARAWAARRGLRLVPVGLERHRAAACLARGTGMPMILACGGAIPLRDRAVDVVLVSQVAHHLARPSCVALVREAVRVARHGVVIADLRRSPAAARAWRPVGRLLGFDTHTIADGATSLRRGFTAAGLRGILRDAGIETDVRVRRGVRLVAGWRVAESHAYG